eukprot:scaffold248363_cov15-Prasinocladus_malaysianus.AAC.1
MARGRQAEITKRARDSKSASIFLRHTKSGVSELPGNRKLRSEQWLQWCFSAARKQPRNCDTFESSAVWLVSSHPKIIRCFV